MSITESQNNQQKTHLKALIPTLVSRACYGMEWKKNFRMEYGIVKV